MSGPVATLFDATPCKLGEGPFWHPTLEQLFWFDIIGARMLAQVDGRTMSRSFSQMVSAAGWVDETTLIVGAQNAVLKVDLDGGEEVLAELEPDRPTRSNDGRADPQGGFWISTIGMEDNPGQGAIYRYYRGELRQLVAGISVPNAICFDPSGAFGYWTDTTTGKVMKQPLDAQGWPAGEAAVWLDVSADGLNPDGAVVDAAGNFWGAFWDAGQVRCYDPSGALLQAIDLPAKQTTCPAFGGPGLATLYVTSAWRGLSETADNAGRQGQTYMIEGVGPGQPEHRVIL